MSALPKSLAAKMSVSEFLPWAEMQPGRYELVHGDPVQMQSERLRHIIVKGNVYAALRAAVRASGLSCVVLTDGATVVISDDTSYEPDATVQCGPLDDLDGVTVSAPTIVVEVQSPSSAAADSSTKAADYMTVRSIAHILIVDPKLCRVMHHERQKNSAFLTRLAGTADELVLAPPGFNVPVARFFDGL